MKVKTFFLLLALILISSPQVFCRLSGKSFHLVFQQQVVTVLAANKDSESTQGIDYYWKQAQSNCQSEVRDVIQYGLFERQLSKLTKCMFERNQEEIKNCKSNFLQQVVQPIQEQMNVETEYETHKQQVKKSMIFNSKLLKKPSGSFLV
ncbi:hypothetical protein TTHERM_00652540 (macronuclear) [Tetrahymena thermophila SB210]|uniref:Transmembrane protein n=1 Tax=Tetrahymena thermophila (strain SB210) TaxID=312017 RepID=Q23B24_TETTS|nr:hypothetical protein TTHERM_00652540 [Tetrahymena thermophila SB210]EAR93660.1 hypothetical protein TTHERM_00652540 [Tetrahymena thermophila SB210]|eukprot:XP_001013905.1 hypothetical protein TTHERM_00652540 [Tetrahymena thermophila SB210]